MAKKPLALFMATAFLAAFLLAGASSSRVSAWSNGGDSADITHPDYGTHDWIAEHALNMLPASERQFISDQLSWFLYGTELPDNKNTPSGIGDASAKHHIYFFANGSIQDDSSAKRAKEEYAKAEQAFSTGNLTDAVMRLGIVTHYIDDMAVFGHMMGVSTAWGTEVHHSDYEEHVKVRTLTYQSEFDSYLVFDQNWNFSSAYDAAIALARDTTFSTNGNCTWMDQHYNWSDPAFKNRAGESLNLAVNAVADVLHTFYVERVVPEFPSGTLLAVLMIVAVALAVCFRKRLMKNAD